MSDNFVEMFRFNSWANLKLTELCRDLAPEVRDSDLAVDGTYGTIRNTLDHIIGVQEHYLGVYNQPTEAPVTDGDFWDLIVDRARKSSAAYEAWADRSPEGDVIEADFGDTTWKTPSWVVIGQMIVHGTDHRSQIATALSQLGIEPPTLDMWAYGGDSGAIETFPKASPTIQA